MTGFLLAGPGEWCRSSKLFEISPTRIIVQSLWREYMMGNLSGLMDVVLMWRFCALLRHVSAIHAARFQPVPSLALLYVE